AQLRDLKSYTDKYYSKRDKETQTKLQKIDKLNLQLLKKYKNVSAKDDILKLDGNISKLSEERKNLLLENMAETDLKQFKLDAKGMMSKPIQAQKDFLKTYTTKIL